MRALVLTMILGAVVLHAEVDQFEGLWQGYDGEWGHVSRQLVALAEAIPVEKFTWRPAPGVRSTSEVFMHLALANFYSPKLETTITSKPEVISWLVLIWLLQQAPIGSVEGCPDRRFPRRCANFKPTSPAKRPASSIWPPVAGPLASSPPHADTGAPTNW